MRIVYLASDFKIVSETFISDLVEGLAKAQPVTVVCNSLARKTIAEHYTINQVSFLSLTSIFDRLQYRLNSVFSSFGTARNYQIRLNHAYQTLTPLLRRHQPDVAYIDYGTVSALVRSALQTLNIPFIVHFHGADITSALNNLDYRQELQQVFRDASALIVASDHVRRLLVLEGASPDKVHVVRYAINLEGLSPIPWSERRKLSPSVVFLGRLTPKKHPVALVEAFARVNQQVPDAQLSIIGDGSEMPRVKKRIEKLGLKDSVKLYGTLLRTEALPIVNQHWVFAQHSVTASSGDQEGFGISLAEAAALDLPVVSTLHNGIPEQVIDGKTGFLVREFDYETMADHLVKLLLNADLAAQMGQAGRANISLLCQTDERVQKIIKLLQTITAEAA